MYRDQGCCFVTILGHISVAEKLCQMANDTRESRLIRTCITSRSCTYLRSVSTNSRMILFRSASGPFAGVGIAGISGPMESKESWGENAEGGEGGAASSNTSGGRRSTICVTVLTIFEDHLANLKSMKLDMKHTLTKPSELVRSHKSVTVNCSP